MRHTKTILGCSIVLFAFSMMAGCCTAPGVNPFVDDSLKTDAWFTPSADGIAAYDAEPVIRHKEIPGISVNQQPSVPHYPLGWEDPFEDQGDNNDTFAWTWQDFFHGMGYGPGRFIVNTIGIPVTVCVTPPWRTQISDGVVIASEHPHDARSGQSPDPVGKWSDLVKAEGPGEPLKIIDVEDTQDTEDVK